MTGKEKRKKQQEEIARIVVPYEDIEPENVSHLIQNSEGKYIVFLDAEGDLDWETTDACGVSEKKLFIEWVGD